MYVALSATSIMGIKIESPPLPSPVFLEGRHMRNVVAPPPATPIEPVTEVLHGVEITDPYRWLEDQNSPRTRKWIEEQTAYTRAYLDAIPGRDRIPNRVGELLADKDVISDPWHIGNRYFFLKRQQNGEQHS